MKLRLSVLTFNILSRHKNFVLPGVLAGDLTDFTKKYVGVYFSRILWEHIS